MKKTTVLICTIFFAFTLYGQQKVAKKVNRILSERMVINTFSPFIESEHQHVDMKDFVDSATYAILNREVVRDIAENKYSNIRLKIPYNGKNIEVLLYRVEITAKGFHADILRQNDIIYTKGAHYRGIIEGDENSLVSFNFFDSEANGIISSRELNNLVVGPLSGINREVYVIYSDANLMFQDEHRCHTDTSESGHDEELPVRPRNMQADGPCVKVYLEVANEIYVQNASDNTKALNWVLSLFNSVQTIFFNDGINVAIESVFIWTEPDPYTGVTAQERYNEFSALAEYDADIAGLIDGWGGAGGLGWVNAICDENQIFYADTYSVVTPFLPLYASNVKTIAHEMGHNLGCKHTHDCVWNDNYSAIDGCGTALGYPGDWDCNRPMPGPGEGTIMSYCHLISSVGINLANGFGPWPSEKMQQVISEAACVSNDCTDCINTVFDFAVATPDVTSATISWGDEGTGPWQVCYTAMEGDFTAWQTVTVNHITYEGLIPNTYYRFKIRPACSAGEAYLEREFVFGTGADWCSGAVFTDPGGETGNYEDLSYIVRTISPPNPNQDVIVTITSFDTELDYDFLYIYDGPDIHAPLIDKYGHSNDPEPPVVYQSTSSDGSLTFVFASNLINNAPGWSAMVSCSDLGIDKAEYTDFKYYPNPAQNVVNISAMEELGQVYVYNVTGQLLLETKTGSATETIDISSFAAGVYLFKVSNNDKKAIFRIIKQ